MSGLGLSYYAEFVAEVDLLLRWKDLSGRLNLTKDHCHCGKVVNLSYFLVFCVGS
jgi:hypothetical protein